MIILEDVYKVFYTRGTSHVVADHINAIFPTGKSVALIGRNGAGKSSLLKMIAGTLNTTSGRILSDGNVSWPVGFGGSFNKHLTGAQNIRFIARVYGVDSDELCAFVEDFAELGKHFYLPIGNYSSGMKSRLSFGVSMGIKFDTYLVDEVTSVGDASFRAKSRAVFLERLRTSGAVVVSHGMASLRKICDSGAVLENGVLTYYEDIEDAIAAHQANMGEEEEEG